MSLKNKLSIISTLIVLALPSILKAEISELKTVEVQLEEVNQYQMLDGQVEAVNKSTVSAQTAGVISKLPYDVGDYAKKGSLIARISSQYQKSGLQQAKASVGEARAAISRATAAIVQAEASQREARSNYAVARAEFMRVKGLYGKRILTKSQYDQAEGGMKSALARLESSKANAVAAKAGKNAAKSGLSAANAGLSKAGEQLGYTEVFAPYSGIVTERLVELGEVVSEGSPIMTGISLQELRVVTDVPQGLILKVRKYNSARIFTADDKIGFSASNLTIFPYADVLTNAFKVRASLDSAPKGLFPGVFVKIGFEVGKEQQLVVPVTSIAYRGELTGVYVINAEGMPRLRQLRIGRTTVNEMVRVLAGLDAGEIIATDPTHAAVYLKQKQKDENKKAASHE